MSRIYLFIEVWKLFRIHEKISSIHFYLYKEYRIRTTLQIRELFAIFDVFKGHMGKAVEILLEENKVFYVVILDNCTDLL